MRTNTILIIVCKGTKENGKIIHCNFLYDGHWGDSKLMEHQKYHELKITKNYCWLGYDTPQSFGKFSGRDGKRI